MNNAHKLIPVTKWNNHHDWPPIGGLRNLIFKSRENANDFATAFKRVLFDEQAVLIMVALNAALSSGKVNNPIGYLHSLIKATQDGTFTEPTAPTIPINRKLDETSALLAKRRESSHIDVTKAQSFMQQIKQAVGVRS